MVANWKMNHTLPSALSYMDRAVGAIRGDLWDRTWIAPPLVNLAPLVEAYPTRCWGSQSVHEQPKGAYTGEVSAEMVAAVGGIFSLAGHSERGETDEQVALQVSQIHGASMAAVLCVGEPLEVRKEGQSVPYVLGQLRRRLAHLDSEHRSLLLIAYEPVWAIGSGVAAPLHEIEAMMGAMRSVCVDLWGEEGRSVPLLYGGAVKADNWGSIRQNCDVQGVLVGGASLTVDSFGRLLSCA